MIEFEKLNAQLLLNAINQVGRTLVIKMGSKKPYYELLNNANHNDIITDDYNTTLEKFLHAGFGAKQYQQILLTKDVKQIYLKNCFSQCDAFLHWFVAHQKIYAPSISFRDLSGYCLSKKQRAYILTHGSETFPEFSYYDLETLMEMTRELNSGHEVCLAFLNKHLTHLDKPTAQTDLHLRDQLMKTFPEYLDRFSHLPGVKELFIDTKPSSFHDIEAGACYHYQHDVFQAAKNYPMQGYMPYHYQALLEKLFSTLKQASTMIAQYRMEKESGHESLYHIYLDMTPACEMSKKEVQDWIERYYLFVQTHGTHFCDHRADKTLVEKAILSWVLHDKMEHSLVCNQSDNPGAKRLKI